MTVPITPTSRLQRSETILTTELSPAEVLMMDPQEGKYFSLKDTAAAIWAKFAEPSTLDTVIAALSTEYQVDPETCRTETTACVEDMVRRGLLVAG